MQDKEQTNRKELIDDIKDRLIHLNYEQLKMSARYLEQMLIRQDTPSSGEDEVAAEK